MQTSLVTHLISCFLSFFGDFCRKTILEVFPLKMAQGNLYFNALWIGERNEFHKA